MSSEKSPILSGKNLESISHANEMFFVMLNLELPISHMTQTYILYIKIYTLLSFFIARFKLNRNNAGAVNEKFTFFFF